MGNAIKIVVLLVAALGTLAVFLMDYGDFLGIVDREVFRGAGVGMVVTGWIVVLAIVLRRKPSQA